MYSYKPSPDQQRILRHVYRQETGTSVPEERRPLAPLLDKLQPHLVRIYWQLLGDYVRSGCPFGESNDGLLLWYEFDQQARSN